MKKVYSKFSRTICTSIICSIAMFVPVCANAQCGIISTIAGNGYGASMGPGGGGYSGNGGTATMAELNGPLGVALDASGNIYIADFYNQVIRKVTPGGVISTIAGNYGGGTGMGAFSGDGGPATAAELWSPSSVTVDGYGNVYFTDEGNDRIRKVTTSGIISTIAGNGTLGYSGDGGPATAAELYDPAGIAVDGSGNLYISELYNNVVRKISSGGTINTIAGNGFGAGTGSGGYSGDGGYATLAELSSPEGVSVDASGNVYIADEGNDRIRKVTPGGIITTIAGNGTYGYSGDGGSATTAELYAPIDVIVDGSGNVYIADYNNNVIRKMTTGGIITTFAGNGFGAGTGSGGYSGDGSSATAAELFSPTGVALDSMGNLYIGDVGNNVIRKVGGCATYVPLLHETNNSTQEVFPNPTIGICYIQASIQVDVKFFSIEGRLLQEQKNATEIDLKTYSNGMYYLYFYDHSTGAYLSTEKVIKLGD